MTNFKDKVLWAEHEPCPRCGEACSHYKYGKNGLFHFVCDRHNNIISWTRAYWRLINEGSERKELPKYERETLVS